MRLHELPYLAIVAWLGMGGAFSTPVDAQPAPSAIDGVWMGSVRVPGQFLSVRLTVKSDAAGHELCTLDIIELGDLGLSCTNVSFAQRNFSFEIPSAEASWAGKLSENGRALSGTWTQMGARSLDFVRQDRP